MTNLTERPMIPTNGAKADWSLHTLGDEADLAELDRREGHEYLPMDVCICPKEQREHFAAASILERLTSLHRLHHFAARGHG
jgi:hypothetical protein